MIVSILFAIAFLTFSILYIKTKKRKSALKSALNDIELKYQKSIPEINTTKEENEVLEAELKIIKQIYRTKLLQHYKFKDEEEAA